MDAVRAPIVAAIQVQEHALVQVIALRPVPGGQVGMVAHVQHGDGARGLAQLHHPHVVRAEGAIAVVQKVVFVGLHHGDPSVVSGTYLINPA
ncbi:hypothetical protein D3C72_2077090 [compost metagenome]